MDTNWTISISSEIIVPQIPFTGIVENGQGPPEVTGTVELPQGGSVASKSFGRNTTYGPGAEPGSHVQSDFETLWSSLLPGLARDCFSDIDTAASRLQDLEFFGTNLLKNRYAAVQGEYTDNENEAAAFNIIMEGAHIKITVSGHIPNTEEIKAAAVEEITNMIGGILA